MTKPASGECKAGAPEIRQNWLALCNWRRQLGAQKKRAVFRNSDHRQRFSVRAYHQQPITTEIDLSISHHASWYFASLAALLPLWMNWQIFCTVTG